MRDAGDVGGRRPKRKDVFAMGAENAVEASRPSAFEVLAELEVGVKLLIDFFKRVFLGKGVPSPDERARRLMERTTRGVVFVRGEIKVAANKIAISTGNGV